MLCTKIVRNYSNFIRNSLLERHKGIVTKAMSPLYSSWVKPPLRITNYNYFETPTSLLQKAKELTKIQIRRGSTIKDYTNHWKVERLTSALLIPLFPLIFFVNSKILETLCSTIVVLHNYWALKIVVSEYFKPAFVGNLFSKIMYMAPLLLSAFIMFGLLVLIFNGDGIANSVKKGWAVGKEKHKQSF